MSRKQPLSAPKNKTHRSDRSNSNPGYPQHPKAIQINAHPRNAQSTISIYSNQDSAFSPTLIKANSLQRRSAIHTDYGKSPVSLTAKDKVSFDYNVFVTTWQDQIKMRQYANCEKYCLEVIDKLLAAEDHLQLNNGFSTMLNATNSDPRANKKQSVDNDEADADAELEDLLQYRSKVHFSLAYLLKKYFKRYDAARVQYEESIKTDRENPGAHFNLANMLVDHYKDYDTAQFHFKRAIELEPMYTLYRMTYAEFLWHDMGRYKESGNQYEELIKSNTDNADIYFNYGLLLRDYLDDVQKALQQFQFVLEISPKDKEALEELNYTQSMLTEEEKQKIKIDVVDHNHNTSSSAKQDKGKAYHNDRKKNSVFRKSQHEINLASVSADDNDDYKTKYYNAMDEQKELTRELKKVQRQQRVQNDELLKIKEIVNGQMNFMKNLGLLVQNGANYCEVNAKKAHKILSVCNDIMGELQNISIVTDDKGNTTAVIPNGGTHSHEPSVV